MWLKYSSKLFEYFSYFLKEKIPSPADERAPRGGSKQKPGLIFVPLDNPTGDELQVGERSDTHESTSSPPNESSTPLTTTPMKNTHEMRRNEDDAFTYRGEQHETYHIPDRAYVEECYPPDHSRIDHQTCNQTSPYIENHGLYNADKAYWPCAGPTHETYTLPNQNDRKVFDVEETTRMRYADRPQPYPPIPALPTYPPVIAPPAYPPVSSARGHKTAWEDPVKLSVSDFPAGNVNQSEMFQGYVSYYPDEVIFPNQDGYRHEGSYPSERGYLPEEGLLHDEKGAHSASGEMHQNPRTQQYANEPGSPKIPQARKAWSIDSRQELQSNQNLDLTDSGRFKDPVNRQHTPREQMRTPRRDCSSTPPRASDEQTAGNYEQWNIVPNDLPPNSSHCKGQSSISPGERETSNEEKRHIPAARVPNMGSSSSTPSAWTVQLEEPETQMRDTVIPSKKDSEEKSPNTEDNGGFIALKNEMDQSSPPQQGSPENKNYAMMVVAGVEAEILSPLV